MKRSELPYLPQFFDRYITQVENIDLIESLEQLSPIHFRESEIEVLTQLGDKRYAEGKWTVKDILQHVIDNERIQSYRALRFAREDKTALPGYDEELLGHTANAQRRTVDEILNELEAVREATILLFNSFNKEMLLREGICFNTKVTVLSLGFVIAGHQIHHFNIIKERYYPLLGK